MGDVSLEVCIVIDAGRFSAARIVNIASGWSGALRRCVDSADLRASVSATLVTTDELIRGDELFGGTTQGSSPSAHAIRSRGAALARARSEGLLNPDDPRMFRAGLVRALEASGMGGLQRRQRVLAIYRQSFNYPGSSEEEDILEACGAAAAGRATVLLIGRKVSGRESDAVRLWTLSDETLRSAENVADHAWGVLADRVRAAEAVTPAAAHAHRATATAVLMCDSCGSTPPGCRFGDHCTVCHMGHLHEVIVSAPVPVPVPTPAPEVPTARGPLRPTPAAPPPRPASAGVPPRPPSRTPSTHPPAWPHPPSSRFGLRSTVPRGVARLVWLSMLLLLWWLIAKCAGG